MKKVNKTYHLEQSIGPRTSNSPGRIVKNQNKSMKEKSSHRQNTSSTQSRKHEFDQINKKTEEKLQKNQLSKNSQKSYNEQFGHVSHFGDQHELSMNRSEMVGMRQETAINPYEQIYHNDMKYFQEYLNSTAKYEYNGINLNWPYYFTKNKSQIN